VFFYAAKVNTRFVTVSTVVQNHAHAKKIHTLGVVNVLSYDY